MANAKLSSAQDSKAWLWQIKLDRKLSQRTTFRTPYGRHKLLRLSLASARHQRCSSKPWNLSEGYPFANIVDDNLLWGSTIKEHYANLTEVLDRAREVGLKLDINSSGREVSPS